MPELPEYYKRARLSQSGPIGRAPDAGAAHRAVGEAGAVMTQFGLAVLDKFLKAEAVDQFNNFRAETIAQVDDYERTLDPTQDTKNWEKGLDELLMKRRNAALPALSNPEARRNAESWLTGQQVEWKSKVYWSARKAKTDQMEASAEANINSYVQRAIEAPDEKTLADSLESLHNEIDSRTTKEGYIGIFSEPQAKLLRQKLDDEIKTKRPLFLHKTQLDAALREAGMNPEGIIEATKQSISSGKPWPEYPDLDSEDWRAVKQRAEATLVERNATATAEYKAAVNKGVQAIQEKLYQKKDFTDIFKFIDETLPAEAVSEREHWYDKATAMMKAAVSEEDNPFEKTMNLPKKQELLEKAARDQVKHDEIDKWVGRKDGISIADGQQVHDVLDQPAHKYRSSWAQNLTKGIDQAYSLKEKAIEGDVSKLPELQSWYAQKQKEIDAFIQKHQAAGTEPTPAEIQQFLNSILVEATADSKFWDYVKTAFTPPIIHAGRIGYLRYKLGKEKAKAETIGTPSVPIAKRMPGESAAEFLLRRQRQEVAKNE